MSAQQILEQAGREMQDRAKTYDKPEGERSMMATVNAYNAITGHHLTETQGWLFMALLKAVRSQQGSYRADSYIDGAAYFALMGESAEPQIAKTLEAMMAPDTKVKAWEQPDYCDSETYDEARIDAIGQNWNDGQHYKEGLLYHTCNHPRWHYYQSTHTKACTVCSHIEPWHGG